jgi:hypothetical protein
MFFLANGKYGGVGGGRNLALLSVLKTADTKYFIFLNIFFPS